MSFEAISSPLLMQFPGYRPPLCGDLPGRSRPLGQAPEQRWQGYTTQNHFIVVEFLYLLYWFLDLSERSRQDELRHSMKMGLQMALKRGPGDFEDPAGGNVEEWAMTPMLMPQVRTIARLATMIFLS